MRQSGAGLAETLLTAQDVLIQPVESQVFTSHALPVGFGGVVLRQDKAFGLEVVDLAKDPLAAGPLARSTTRNSKLTKQSSASSFSPCRKHNYESRDSRGFCQGFVVWMARLSRLWVIC